MLVPVLCYRRMSSIKVLLLSIFIAHIAYTNLGFFPQLWQVFTCTTGCVYCTVSPLQLLQLFFCCRRCCFWLSPHLPKMFYQIWFIRVKISIILPNVTMWIFSSLAFHMTSLTMYFLLWTDANLSGFAPLH